MLRVFHLFSTFMINKKIKVKLIVILRPSYFLISFAVCVTFWQDRLHLAIVRCVTKVTYKVMRELTGLAVWGQLWTNMAVSQSSNAC